MTAQRVTALWLADQLRYQIQSYAAINTLLWDRRAVHLDLERIFRPIFPRLVHGEIRSWGKKVIMSLRILDSRSYGS